MRRPYFLIAAAIAMSATGARAQVADNTVKVTGDTCTLSKMSDAKQKSVTITVLAKVSGEGAGSFVIPESILPLKEGARYDISDWQSSPNVEAGLRYRRGKLELWKAATTDFFESDELTLWIDANLESPSYAWLQEGIHYLHVPFSGLKCQF